MKMLSTFRSNNFVTRQSYFCPQKKTKEYISQGHLGPGTLGNVIGGTGQDILGYPRISQDIPGTSGTWDSGQCPRWDRTGHPGISQGHLGPGTISQGHLGPGTLGNVLGGTG